MQKMGHCFVCQNDNVKSCSRCHSISYCSKQCQKLDWKRHKADCNNTVTEENIHVEESIITKTATSLTFNCKETIETVQNSASTVSCFILTEVPRKGAGLIATRDIAYGDLVIREHPIMETGPLPCLKEKDLQKLFSKLSIEDQNTIMTMHDAHAIDGVKSLVGIVNTNSLARFV